VLVHQRRANSIALSSPRANSSCPSRSGSPLLSPPVACQTSLPSPVIISPRALVSTMLSPLSTPHPTQPTAPPARAPKVKPKKPPFPGSPLAKASSPAASLRRSVSAAALREASHHDDEVESALAQGLVAEADINVYRMRTPWEGILLSFSVLPYSCLTIVLGHASVNKATQIVGVGDSVNACLDQNW
jgi:hypothetical protein